MQFLQQRIHLSRASKSKGRMLRRAKRAGKKLKIEVATKSASRRTCLGTDASPLVDGFARGYLPAMNCALERGREVKEREREEWR